MEKARVLIAEDEGIIAEDLRGMLLKLGYAVVGVTDSGEEAVQWALELRPDLVLLDFSLHGQMSGVEAGNLIQQSGACAVVYVTGNADALKQPDVIRKPFSMATISGGIEAALLKARNR